MTIYVRDRDGLQSLCPALEAVSGPLEAALASRSSALGFCRSCNGVRVFDVAKGQPSGQWVNLLEGLVCECGLNGRMRLILKTFHQVTALRHFDHSAVLERLTPLFPHLLERCRGLIGAEYLGGDMAPGAYKTIGDVSVRHEGMLHLSFARSSLDLFMHFDVLEHVPDVRLALDECARVLRADGVLLLSWPFYHRLEENTVRAVVVDGKIRHLMEPGYHGNPVDGAGSLVFTHPSWALLTQLAAAGFCDVRMAVQYDPLEGIVSNGCPYPDGHMWPVVFIAAKSKGVLDPWS